MSDYTQNIGRDPPVPRDELHIDHPPRGIKMERTYDGATVINARMFSGATFGAFLFALFWNGFAWIFFGNTINATAAKLGIKTGFTPIPPADFAPPLWCALIFILPGLFLLVPALYRVLGRMEIRVRADEGSVFRGVGPVGRTQRFSPQSVKSVSNRESGMKVNDQPVFCLAIEMNNGREIKLPALGKIRETWIAFALREILKLDTPAQ